MIKSIIFASLSFGAPVGARGVNNQSRLTLRRLSEDLYGHSNCPCLGALPASTPETDCPYHWALKGKCVMAEKLNSTFKAYPGDYGTICKKHLEPGQKDCFDITASPPQEKPLSEQKSWCNDKWCYVDPCNCDKADITRSDYFPSTLRYSYETCGAENTYSEDTGSSNIVGDVQCTARGVTAKSAKCRIQKSNVFSEKEPTCSEPAATLKVDTSHFKTVNTVPSRFSEDETYGHDKWYPASGVCKLPGDPKSADRSGYLWLPGPVKAGTSREGPCRESPSCGGVPTTEDYPEDAAMSIFYRHGVLGTSFCCGSSDFETWNLCESISHEGPNYEGYSPSHKWTSKTQPYTVSGCGTLYEYESTCPSEEISSMPAENCPIYEYHSVMHTPLIKDSYPLFVCWIFFLCLTFVCCGGAAALKQPAVLAGALLSTLVGLGCLFAWTGVMVEYWDGCWGEWDPNRVVDAGNLLHGVSENSFRANCWPPLKGTQCSPTCYTHFVQKPGKGLKCGGIVYDFVDNDDPLVCMPPCKAKILGEGHIPEMLPFAQTYTEVEVSCDVDAGFVRTDGGTDVGTAVCNKEEKGGLDGPWVHDIMCRVGRNCDTALLNNDIFDGAGKAFDALDGVKCVEIEADEPGMPPSYECTLPGVSHMCSLPMRCAVNHVAQDPNQDPVAYCHDGAWEIRNPCFLEIAGLERSLVEAFFWITVVVLPIGGFCGCCAGCVGVARNKDDKKVLWSLIGALVGMIVGTLAIFVLILAFFFIIVTIFSLPLIIFIVIAFSATYFVALKSKIEKKRERKSESAMEKQDEAKALYAKIKSRLAVAYDKMFHTVAGRATVRAVYNAPLRAAFLFIRWTLDVYLIATTIDAFFVPETPINFNFPLGIGDINVDLSGLENLFEELAKAMDFINIKNILSLDFRCDGLVFLFGSFVLLAVEIFVLAFGAFDYLGFHKLTEALCEKHLHGPRKAFFKKVLQFLENVSNYGIQFVILIAQRRVGDVKRAQVYGACPLEDATFALIYGKCSAGLIAFTGFILWAFLVNGHITPRNILKKAGKEDPISYKVDGDDRLDDVRLPLKFMFVWQSSWGIWTSFSCAGYRLSSRIHVYTGLLFASEDEEVRKSKAEELAQHCKMRVVLAKATAKLVSICWQVIPFIGIFMSKISMYLNEDPNPLLVWDEELRSEMGAFSESAFAKKIFQGLKCVLNDLLLSFMMMGVFQGGWQPVQFAFWFCIAKSYLEKFEDVLDWYKENSGSSKVHDEESLKELAADHAAGKITEKAQEGASQIEKKISNKQKQKDSKKKAGKEAWQSPVPQKYTEDEEMADDDLVC